MPTTPERANHPAAFQWNKNGACVNRRSIPNTNPANTILTARTTGKPILTPIFDMAARVMNMFPAKHSIESSAKTIPMRAAAPCRSPLCVRLHPFIRSPLGLGDLLRLHQSFHHVAVLSRSFLAIRRRDTPPFVRLDIVHRNAFLPCFVYPAQVELRGRIAAFSCLLVPEHCLFVVQRDALSRLVHQGEGGLRPCMSVFPCLLVPESRLLVVLRNALPGLVHAAHVELRLHHALIGRFLVPGHGLPDVRRNALPLFIHRTQIDLRRRITLVCPLLVPGTGPPFLL